VSFDNTSERSRVIFVQNNKNENSLSPRTSAPASPQERWNAALLANGGHLLQSWEWGEFKSRHGWQAERVSVHGADGDGYAQVLFRAKGPVSIGYIPRGPLMTGDADKVWPELRNEIDKSARRHRAITVIIEPDHHLGLTGTYGNAGVVQGPAHLQPERTVKIPLLDDEAILKQMHSKTRYSVRLAMRRGVEIEIKDPGDSVALDRCYGLMEDTANRNEFSIHSRQYYADFLDVFGDRALFTFASWEGHLASVIIAAAFGEEAIYMYGASSTEHRGHGASFLLQFEAMKWGRQQGCRRYDLWGIPKDDPESLAGEDRRSLAGTKGDDWRGIYRFKTGFGGDIVSYPDTLERRYVPVLPWLARATGVIQG
jgi:peptidoglycan pentaglycine glycine transferase (the first glycine)